MDRLHKTATEIATYMPYTTKWLQQVAAGILRTLGADFLETPPVNITWIDVVVLHKILSIVNDKYDAQYVARVIFGIDKVE